MDLFLINRLPKKNENTYDEFLGFVVAAESDRKAIELVVARDCEWKQEWFNPAFATCERIGTANGDTPRIVLESYHAG